MKNNQVLASGIMISVAYTALAVLILHFLQPNKNPTINAISEYVEGRGGSLMTSVFFVQALGSIALAMLIFGIKPRSGKIISGAILFILAALGDVLAGLFPADPITNETMSSTGAIHTLGGLTRFLSLAIGLPLVSTVLKKQEHWLQYSKLLKALAITFLVTFLITLFLLAPTGFFGLGQRVFILIALFWMFIVALPLARIKSS